MIYTILMCYAILQQRNKNLKYEDSNEINGYWGLNYIYVYTYIDGMAIIYAINNHQMECENDVLKYRMFF